MDDEQKVPIENNDSNLFLAPAADPSVQMEIVLFGPSQNPPGAGVAPLGQEGPETQTTPAVSLRPASVASDEQSLRDELLGNDSLGG
jgi:hypothetical protein